MPRDSGSVGGDPGLCVLINCSSSQVIPMFNVVFSPQSVRHSTGQRRLTSESVIKQRINITFYLLVICLDTPNTFKRGAQMKMKVVKE